MNITHLAQEIIANIPYEAPEIIDGDALLVMLTEALFNAYEQGKRDALQPGAGSPIECEISPEVATILNDPRASITLLRLPDLFERAGLGTSGGGL